MKIKDTLHINNPNEEFLKQNESVLNKNEEEYSILNNFTNDQELLRRNVLRQEEEIEKLIDFSTEITPVVENKLELETKPEEKEENKVYKWDIVWVNVILLGSLHLLAVYGFYLRVYSQNYHCFATYLIKFMGIASTIGITGGVHRLWTHRSYKANKKLECILMFMATMTYQNSVYIWARDHRLHHKCSETDGDPHNAKRGFFFSHVGWLLVRKHPEVIKQGKTIDMSDLEANPIVMFQHKYYYLLVTLCTFVLPGLIAYYGGFNISESILTAIIYKYVVSVNLTWCINSVAHIFGQRPYNKNIGPTESQMMRYLGFGEGFHNYHHTFPWDYKAAEFGQDCRNVTTAFIDFFAWLGWATDRRVASQELIENRCKRTGGPGREYHMMKDSPDRFAHNIASFLLIAVFLYLI